VRWRGPAADVYLSTIADGVDETDDAEVQSRVEQPSR
jgi:hypothetical protein